MKLKEFRKNIEEWLTQLRLEEKSKNTIATYKNNLNQFLRFLEKNNIENIDKLILLEYKDFLKAQEEEGIIKTSTLNSRIKTVNKFFANTGKKDLTVKTQKVQNNLEFKDAMTEKDYQGLLKYLLFNQNDRENLKYYFLCRVLGETGIRISELKFFTVENLKNMNGKLKVENKGKLRDVYLSKELKTALLNYAQENNITGIIFHGRNKNKMLDRTVIYRQLKKIAKKANVNESLIHPHSFRHRFSLSYLEKNSNDNQALINLSNILGHSSLDTTRVYLKPSDKDLEKSITNLYNYKETF